MEKDNESPVMRGGAPITGVLGTVLGGGAMLIAMAAGGMGLFGGGNGRGPSLAQQVQMLQNELANVKADVAVNTQRDIDLARQTELMIENAKKDAEIQVLKAKAELGNQLVAVNNQVLTNAGILGCVVGKVDSLTQLGIPAANIITPPATATGTSTAGA